MTQGYSQHGEDVYIFERLSDAVTRCIVDVGANDGVSWSNSRLFAERGFRSLLIEPMPKFADMCRAVYAGNSDVKIEQLAVSDVSGKVTFYCNDDVEHDLLAMRSSLNFEAVPGGKVTPIEVEVVRLSDLLEAHQFPSTYAMLSVDAEGHDFEVLKGANLRRFRPEFICVEHGESEAKPIFEFLLSENYEKLTQLGPNGIYKAK